MTDLLHTQLERSADASPDRLAAAVGDTTMTYSELEARANQIAHLLRDIGVGSGHRVAIFIDKSLDALAAIYGTMKAGAAYVPLDPAAPASRIAQIIGDCEISHMISSVKKAAAWDEVAALGGGLSHIIAPDVTDVEGTTVPAQTRLLGADAVAAAATSRLDGDVTESDLALILYTSGSTGTPKGVMLSHLNVMAFVAWGVEEFAITAEDRLSQFAPMHFDLSTLDIFGAARAGASVHLVTRQTIMFPTQIRKFLESNNISFMYCVPSILTMMTERAGLEVGDLPGLRTVLFAGEVFPTKYLSRIMNLLPHAEFANLFGPTETNACTFYRVPEPPRPDGPPVLIGRAISGAVTSVVSETGDLVEPGEVGELWVRGPVVMQGYWATGPTVGDEAGLYRTGDLVRENSSGDYEFIGRRDSQIKSRGYRIELGDIEAALLAHPDVVEGAAIPVPDDMVTNRIMAHVVVDQGLTAEELNRFLADRLPKYMIPEIFEFSEGLPKTSTGKIDRQLLSSAISEDN